MLTQVVLEGNNLLGMLESGRPLRLLGHSHLLGWSAVLSSSRLRGHAYNVLESGVIRHQDGIDGVRKARVGAFNNASRSHDRFGRWRQAPRGAWMQWRPGEAAPGAAQRKEGIHR